MLPWVSPMADVGADNFEQEFALGLMDSERKLLAEINDALKRIVEKCYGSIGKINTTSLP